MRICYHTSPIFDDGPNEDGVTEYSVCKSYFFFRASLSKFQFSANSFRYDDLPRTLVKVAWFTFNFGLDYEWEPVCSPY